MLSLPTPVHWRMRPRWNGLHVELATDCCTPQPVTMRVRPGFRALGIDVDDSRTQWPAGRTAGAANVAAPFDLEAHGQLSHHRDRRGDTEPAARNPRWRIAVDRRR